MPMLSKPSKEARAALVYITLGALIDVWSAIWYFWLLNRRDEVSDSTWFWCYGFLLTGLTLLIIGFAIGQIGRSARKAELPPEEASATVANADQKAAARAPMVAPNPGQPVAPQAQNVAPPGQVAGGQPLNQPGGQGQTY